MLIFDMQYYKDLAIESAVFTSDQARMQEYEVVYNQIFFATNFTLYKV